MSDEPITGGCQCGAVRYRIRGPLISPHICHCRMCQKAFGSLFAPFANAPATHFELTRGALAIFKSSDPTERGFCRDCGTPLTVKGGPVDHVSVSIGSLDHPERAKPVMQFGTESRMPWFAELAALPGKSTDEWGAEAADAIAQIRATNRQHPDHDTLVWP